MADYQRSIANLQSKLQKLEAEKEEAKKFADSKDGEILSLRKEIEILTKNKQKWEETIAKLKALAVKTKKELAESIQKLEEKSNENSNLEGKLRQSVAELEAIKVI